jgi:DHA2 family multidrug resistance protein
MAHRYALVSHLNSNDPVVEQRVSMVQRSFIGKGMTPDVALQSAYKALDYSVTKQASVLSYMDVFLYLGLLFLVCVPFVLLVKGNRKKKMNVAEAMH